MKFTYFLKLYEDPLIYCVCSGWLMASGVDLCIADAKGRPCDIIVVPYWYVPDEIASYNELSRRLRVHDENCNFHVMCPSQTDADFVTKKGFSAIHAHHNAFIDETLFHPLPQVKKQFSAIHNAALPHWKRHHLAWRVKNICVVTYKHSEKNDFAALSGYKHLSQCNIDSDGKVNYLGQSELCQLICKSNAGLILSRKEGANFASGEYQFCGIPVITTKSRGGRHYFFDEISTFYVPPSAHVISWVVDRIASRYEWDSSAISARAVARAIEGRVRLLDFISNLAGRKVHAEANANAWLPSFRDKLRERIDL